jgi:uncharacterized protein (TIGR02444 family)
MASEFAIITASRISLLPKAHILSPSEPSQTDLESGQATDELSDEDALWRFSLAFYAPPNVSEALLRLQDRAGCDVNLMLFALWLGMSGRRRLATDGLVAAERITAPITRDLVEPLRLLRRGLRSNPDAEIQRLREEIKRLELAAERIVQRRLALLAGVPESNHDHTARASAAFANFVLYLGPELAGAEEVTVIRGALQAFFQD